MKNKILLNLIIFSFISFYSTAQTGGLIKISEEDLIGKWTIKEAKQSGQVIYSANKPGKLRAYKNIEHEFLQNNVYKYTTPQRKQISGVWRWSEAQQQISLKYEDVVIIFNVKEFDKKTITLESTYQGVSYITVLRKKS